MISAIRSKLKGNFLKVVIWFTVLAVGGVTVIGGLFRRFGRQKRTYIGIAEVNGYEVSPYEFRNRVRQFDTLLSNLRQRYGKDADKMFFERQGLPPSPRDAALELLIKQKLLFSAAEDIGIELSQEYITHKLEDPRYVALALSDYIPERLIGEKGVNYAVLLKAWQKQGMPVRCFEDAIQERLKGDAVISLARAGAYTPEFLLKQLFVQSSRDKKFQIIKIPLSYYLNKAKSEPLSDDILRRQYDSLNKFRMYWTPEKRKGFIWTFDKVDEKKFMSEAGELLKNAQNLDNFIKKYNGVKKETGLIEFNKSNKISLKLFSLYLKGKDAFFENGKGYIVELDKIESGSQQPFDKVKDKIKADYDKARAMNLLVEDLKKFEMVPSQDIDAWLKARNATKKTTGFLSPIKEGDWKFLEDEGLGYETHVIRNMINVNEKRATMNMKGDGFIIELKELAPVKSEEALDSKFNEKKSELLQEHSASEEIRVEKGFIDSLEKNGIIRKNKAEFSKLR